MPIRQEYPRKRTLLASAGLFAAALWIGHANAQTTFPTAITEEDGVVATIDGKTVTEREIRLMLPQYDMDFKSISPPQRADLMRQLITQRLLAVKAREQKLDKSPLFEARMRAAEDGALAQVMVENYLKGEGKITEEELFAFYKSNAKAFTKEEIKASHILLKSLKEAEEVLAELKAGKDFAKLAAAKSIGPSSSQGGSLGSFGRGQMVPEFENAAFKLKAGEISEPVKTQFGYHIIKVTERPAPVTVPFERVKPQIQESLLGKKLEAYFKSLQKDAKIVVKDPRFAIGGE